MKDRNAVSTLKGYFYQFDFSILQLLTLADMMDKVTIEAIKFLLMDFAERKNNGSKKIKYMLYGYYSKGQEKLPDIIDFSFLKSNF